jgi:hypothetical protein
MAQGTDLFNSTKGQFAEYTTIIGGEVPQTESWFLDLFETTDNVNAISGTLTIESGLAPTGNMNDTFSFFQNQKTSLKNCATVVEFTTGESVTNFNIGIFGRKTIGGDYVYGLVEQGSALKIYKNESSIDVELESGDVVVLSENRTYWAVMIFVDNTVCFELWGEDPRSAVDNLGNVWTELQDGDETTYDVESEIGVSNWIPRQAAARIKSIEVGRAFADNTDRIDEVVSQKHVDIRDFINYRYPVRFRTIKELNTFHITEKAFSQTITLSDAPTSGTFSLYFYPSDSDPYIPIQIGPFDHAATDSEIKSALNAAINLLPKFSVTDEDPITNVTSLISTQGTLLIEFSESFGEISLLQMYLGALGVISEEIYDSTTQIGTFYPTKFDTSKYIESADPLDKQLTLDDLRMEFKFKNENWTLYSGSGGSGAPSKSYFRDGDLFVGKIVTKENRRGAHLKFGRAMKRAEKTVGGTWSVHVQSFAKAVNCKTIGASSDLYISIPFADYPWNPGSNSSVLDIGASGCYVQFTSDPLGKFSDQDGNSSAESVPVYFEDNLYYNAGEVNSGDVEFLAAMTDFENGAGASFNFSMITAVRILFKGIMPSSASSIKIMGIRAIDESRFISNQWFAAEINTLEQTVVPPCLGYSQTETAICSMISGARTDTIASDPSPIDSKQGIIFQTGLGASTDYNKIMIFAREQEFDDLQKSTWLTSEYQFNMTPDSALRRYKTLRVKSTTPTTPLFWDVHPGGVYEDSYYAGLSGISYLPELAGERNYQISAIFSGNSIGTQIEELTAAEQPQRVVYDAPSVSSEHWNPVSGRIGWYVEFADKDMTVSAFDLESAAYAVLRTKQFVSETPVEGAQLFTVDSGDKNLFERFSPLSPLDRVYVDNQKTSSGSSSYVFESFGRSKNPGVISNQFTVNDWNHIYIEFDIWVPRDLKTLEKRPRFALRPLEQPEGTNGADVFSGIVPLNAPIAFDFVPGAWSHVAFDMRGTQAKNGDYYLTVLSNGDGDQDLSSFRNKWWIDNVQINTQTIEWELRAVENGSWSPFRKNVNRQYGALHLSENQIGKNIQLQARALTEEAWIAEYTLIPKYISSGRILNTNVYILDEQ